MNGYDKQSSSKQAQTNYKHAFIILGIDARRHTTNAMPHAFMQMRSRIEPFNVFIEAKLVSSCLLWP